MSLDAWLFVVLGWTLVVAAFLRLCWMIFACPASLFTRCPKCTYPVDPRVGLRCPECGSEVPEALELNLRRWKRSSYGAVVLLFVCGLVCINVLPGVARSGWWSTVPNAMMTRLGPAGLGKRGETELRRRLESGALRSGDRETLLATCLRLLGAGHSQSDQAVALSLAQALIVHHDSRGWQIVCAAMHHPRLKLRLEAIEAVRFDDDSSHTLVNEELCALVVSGPDLETRKAAIVQLKSRRLAMFPGVRGAFIAALRSEDKRLAWYAAMSTDLYSMRRDLKDGITDLMADPDPWRQRVCMLALTHDSRLSAELSAEASSPGPRSVPDSGK
jgi:hypothetical protein